MRTIQIGGLTVRVAGGDDGQGGGEGPLVVLLHGFGAPGDDLVPLAGELRVPSGTRFVFPHGPLSLNMGYGEARAWWIIDMNRLAQERAVGRLRDLSAEVPRGLPAAREALESLLVDLPKRISVDHDNTIIGGFSQGAMLTCDLVMRTACPCAGLIQLSSTLFARQEWNPDLSPRRGLPVFQSHGTDDEILHYQMAERLRDELCEAGLSVEWHGFQGGHEIPASVMTRLNQFLTNVLSPR
ncbi:esterase [Nitrospira sp.]|nr:esterase [Nitrospira sp.]